MSGERLVQVGMGELKLARDDEVLCALLGSCVGIAMLWRRRNSGVLAHCLLPQSPDLVGSHGARYVNQAVPMMLMLLGARRDQRAEIDVILSGGASMLGPAGLSGGVGASNITAARDVLAQHGMQILHEATGGRRGRTFRLDCREGSFSIAKVERNIEEFGHACN
jgi:chemotaxis protein CheD